MKTAYESRLFDLLGKAETWPDEELEERAAEACAAGPVRSTELLAALGRGSSLDGFLERPAATSSPSPRPCARS